MPLLFSYGTLQDPEVQRATFGRLLPGRPDELHGFERSEVEVAGARHASLTRRGAGRVAGTVYAIEERELDAADRYEQDAGYERITATLASGKEAWVYLHASSR